jgi:hypothetical protein
VEDAGRIIHHAKGIGNDGKGLLTEALSDSIGKTRAHEENLFTGLYEERRFVDGHLRTELHHFT